MSTPIARISHEIMCKPYQAGVGPLSIRGGEFPSIEEVRFNTGAYPGKTLFTKQHIILLDLLARYAGTIVLRREIMLVLYGGNESRWPDQKILGVYIHQIRAVLRTTFGEDIAALVRTVYGLGYALSAEDIETGFSGIRGTIDERIIARGYETIQTGAPH